jgi:hypothetical protein
MRLMSGTVIACLNSNADRATLTQCRLRGVEVNFCTNASDVARRLDAVDPALVVVELDSGDSLEVVRVIEILQSRDRLIPLLLRLELTEASARELAKNATLMANVHASIRGFDDLADGVMAALHNDPRRTPRFTLIDRFAPPAPPAVRSVVVCAATICSRRASPATLATLCGIPLRTLEWRLAEASYPTPRALLGRMLTLHALWNFENLATSPKQIAREMGFSTASGLSNFITRHAGERPSRILAHGGFAYAMTQFVSVLGNAARKPE